jgi:hypothetical protein
VPHVLAVQLDQVEGVNTSSSWCRYRMRSKLANPSGPQATASPSMMQDRERSLASASTAQRHYSRAAGCRANR